MRAALVTDPELGELSWNAESLWWEGTCTMADGTRLPLYVHSLGDMTQGPPFEDATWDRTITPESRIALARVRCSDSIFRAAVSKEYLPLFSHWNDGEQTTAAEFERRLQLESVQLTPDGGALVFFEDDGMFAGHALIAHLDPDGVVRYVEMFG
jgi:hypothetical protein